MIMEQYISKAALVAEIKGYISSYKEIVAKINRNDSTRMDSVSMIDAKIDVLQHVLFFLDTLKVKDEVVSTDPIKAMQEALRIEYEKGRADAIAEMQKEQTKEYLEGVKRVQNYKELTKFEKGFDRIADTYAHRKNKDGYNKPWYTKERAAEMLYWAKEELGIFNEQ